MRTASSVGLTVGMALGLPVALLKLLFLVAVDIVTTGAIMALIFAVIAALVGTDAGAAAWRAATWTGAIVGVASFLFRAVQLYHRMSEISTRLRIAIAEAELESTRAGTEGK